MVAIVALLMTWEWGARSGYITALFFPAPSAIATTLGKMLDDGALTMHLGASLRRVLLGILFGGVPGLLLGLMIGWSRRLHRVIDPLIAATHPIPKIAILPLIMVVFGVGETPKVIIAATSAFFPMVVSTATGARQINRIYFEVARNYGASPLKVLARVVLPGSLPFMLSGLLLALNITLLLTIAVEMVSGYSGLGSMIWFAWETMRVEEIYASLTVITLLGIGFNLMLQRLSRLLVPWQIDQVP
ncbi:MAG: ABC transporter, permease protein (cluster 10, nitrate/sulfonate/bicarbonate) [uncultured Chloroflexia bacterium]|uniref:ABC transporter, permease protein (Cluster 10, nitrate/sulfonate/bicarbonate) n=1 Tax=uncultured Chloroflexia bacterium TaxID=1672391 RepID=A0A6J4IU83_9CHLR|nr:MAG: ABC transporter, permease protein (cluster 10, nitrate/sulfonate/bicarbonate) [uncultured Chloroflexia bacterium]